MLYSVETRGRDFTNHLKQEWAPPFAREANLALFAVAKDGAGTNAWLGRTWLLWSP